MTEEQVMTKTLTVALAGQPNTGKSTVFNRLTGMKQHVGNWPGKTVEQKTGRFRLDGETVHVVDLPGAYTLSSGSDEEEITRDYILQEQPDLVIALVDASQLERSFYIVSELKELQVPLIVALNMMDVAESSGKRVEPRLLEKAIGFPVVSMAAARGEGISELKEAILRYGTEENRAERPFLSPAESAMGRSVLSEEEELAQAGQRYEWIEQVLKGAVYNKRKRTGSGHRAGFDRAATHPVWGKLISLGIILLSFALSMVVAGPIMALIFGKLPLMAEAARQGLQNAPLWFSSLVADGLIPGVGTALTMFSYIVGLFLVFGILEDIGYLARLSVLYDRSMNRLGLHGKSFMPFVISFGCNIGGVMGARVVDSWQQRVVTLFMASIIPCAAVWGVSSFVGVIFFGAGMPLVVFSLLAVTVLHLALTSLLLRKTVVKGETTGLIIELPPYHKPNWKTIGGYVWRNAMAFLKRGVTLIALVSLLIWALSYRADGNIELSLLASIGRFFDPISGLMGMDWRLMIALIAAVASKEATLATLAVLYGAGQSTSSLGELATNHSGLDLAALTGTLSQVVTPATALAFIFAYFFSIPCSGAVGAIYSETRSWKWTGGSCLYYSLSSLVFGILAYNAGLLIFGY